jgi:uncharacterized protein YcfJ
MKKIILFAAIVSVFAACKNNSSTGYDTSKYVLVDTTNLSKSNASTDVMQDAAVTGVKTWDVNRSTSQPVITSQPITSQPMTTTTQNSRSTSHAVYPATTTRTTTTTSTVPRRDRGWSSAAKRTAIGAGTGAVVGALVGKGKGAVIGALIGGGAGYLSGRHKDRKTGRVQRARERRAAGY